MQINTKQISNIYRNLLYSQGSSSINIGSTETNSWYDVCLSAIPDSSLSFFPVYQNSFINYQLYFINNPISFGDLNNESLANVPKILFFHDNSSSISKKEDFHILNEKIQAYPKYSFIPELCNHINDLKIIRYGFKSIDSDLITQKIKGSILFFADANNFNNIIFSNLKQIYPNIEMMASNQNYSNIEHILSKYQILINLTNLSYNTFLAASLGCITISTKEEPIISHHKRITKIEDIHTNLQNILNQYSIQWAENNAHSVSERYPYETFVQSIKNIVNRELGTIS